jgi:hypothetical protein
MRAEGREAIVDEGGERRMKAISLYHPYGALIVAGIKRTETRSWGTSYRGPLLIHAAKRWDSAVIADCGRALEYLERAGLAAPGFDFKRTLGHVLGVANVVHCRPMESAPSPVDAAFGTFGPGRYGWTLEDAAPLPEPIPWAGQMQLWTVPDTLADKVRRALPGFPWGRFPAAAPGTFPFF